MSHWLIFNLRIDLYFVKWSCILAVLFSFNEGVRVRTCIRIIFTSGWDITKYDRLNTLVYRWSLKDKMQIKLQSNKCLSLKSPLGVWHYFSKPACKLRTVHLLYLFILILQAWLYWQQFVTGFALTRSTMSISLSWHTEDCVVPSHFHSSLSPRKTKFPPSGRWCAPVLWSYTSLVSYRLERRLTF